jgi:hypothetical protein
LINAKRHELRKLFFKWLMIYYMGLLTIISFQ